MSVPDRALYKCPEHGLFVVETEGVVWKERSCTHRVYTPAGVFNYPCGILSPLAHVDDPDVNNPGKDIPGLDGPTLQTLRETINQIREQRRQERMHQEDKPSFMFGGPANRRNGRPALPPAPPIIDREQELFEQAERERMRAAIDSWTE
jgi:hypothetical protein